MIKIVLTTFFILLLSLHSNAKECVILLHGLILNHHSMSKMELALQDEGFQTVNVNYPSTKHNIETLAENAISTALSQCPEGTTKIHFVTHSMGGILVRQYLHDHSIDKLGCVVMLGPPNHGSQLVDHLKHLPCFVWINGKAGLQLGTDDQSVPIHLGAVNYEVGIIAGTRSLNPLFSAILPKRDDGKVTVESTKLEGMNDHIALPVTHTFMTQNNTVIQQSIYFLKFGKFDHEGRIPDPYPAFSCNVKRLQTLSH
jgi:pimeloyl-ACP methyl ester carboxylesterase